MFDLVARRALVSFGLGFDPDGLVLSPDGKLLATCDRNEDKRLYVFDAVRGKLLYRSEFAALPLRFARDGKTIIASSDGGLELVDTATGKSRAGFPLAGEMVSDADLSPDGSACLVAKYEAGMTLFNAESRHGIDIRNFDTGDWFAQDRSGSFVCSDGARKFVRFVKGDTMYEAAQFWEGFYTADLFARLLAEAPAAVPPNTAGAAAPEASAIQDAAETMPVVSILQPMKGGVVESPALVVSVQVSDQAGRGLDLPVFLYRNGKAVDRGTRGLDIALKAGVTQFTVPLEAGDNLIQAAALDEKGKVEGRSAELLFSYRPLQVAKPDLYLICIGVGAYKDRNIALKAPAPDAANVAALFEKLAAPLYGKVNCALLTDKAASVRGIMSAFQEVIAAAGPQDAVLVFFAGHGVIEKEVYYFLPYEADVTDLSGSALSIEDINSFVQKASAGKMAIFLDTCQSGGAAKALGTIAMSRGIEEQKAIAMLAKARGIGVLAASSASQAAYEPSQLGQGLLAFALRTAVAERTSAISIEGAISMDKLMSEVMSICSDAALKYAKAEQTPIKYMFGQDYAIGIARK